MGIPSITYSGSLFALTEEVPLIRTRIADPPRALLVVTWTPGTIPCNPPSNELVAAEFNFSTLTLETELVILRLI